MERGARVGVTTVDGGTGPGCGARRGRPVKRSAAALATLVTAALAAGCSAPSTPVDDARGAGHGPAGHRPDGADPAPAAPSPGRPERTPGGADRAPGVRTPPPAGPLLAVKIDNVRAARPQTGLDAADIVYVEPVEGGLSRLMAVYATKLPKAVGPVRSARESDLELLRQFERPVLAFSGAQRKLLPLIGGAPLRAVTPDAAPGAYYRGADGQAPHNLYVRPGRLLPSAPGAAALTTGFRFGAAPDGGTPRTSRTVRYPAARFTFEWSPDRRRWLVSTDGRATTTADGRRAAPATVVVQYMKVRASAYHDSLGNHTPYPETVGAGKAEVLRDGRSYAVRWKRPTAEEGTRFTTNDGRPVAFAPGQVWVVFAKAP
ncbi:DUF3048 domain-containing protein [Streptomyces sp. NPDC088254]|uniref:DUF3048 domain-containing protein n=1 Tax=Streptomyces sp. NPDC088254 TaxID=3365847 RepID=UPI0037FE8E2C